MEREISRAKHMLSKWYPQRIRQGTSTQNPGLELILYKGRVQLGTPEAVYSDGDRYWPAIMAADFWDTQPKALEQVTILGAGLGSLVQVLEGRGYQPNYTLVDYDPLILEWAKEFYPNEAISRSRFVESEAMHYLETQSEPGSQTLVFIDLFQGMEAWPGIEDTRFLSLSRSLLQPSGGFVLNYLVLDPEKWVRLLERVSQVFTKVQWKAHGLNRVLMAIV